ncbi:hypothetical protein KHC23_15810 [Ancylobacter dichloromethanicus]|uniref:hypothetical protein n=1 Tax=Ancylobacter dichloromethanicus TaxID=518825 RepID=UPI001BCBDC1F|nr:hypothetical protein [Ancylobacter dichloromethanicus]MBS7555113.1 hypothetical protein [Ancylobacter dichloromethanicus]
MAFDVKNHVEVMESWPIKKGDTSFFLEREGDVLKRVCLVFSGVGIEHAPHLTPERDGDAQTLTVTGGDYPALARRTIMNWQAVVSGMQIVDLDYDSYELRFRPENIEEEPLIIVLSFKSNSGKALNRACDFEQIGRAFCAGPISDDRIESTSHFREGRIAYEAGRYVDAYNNMFLFLETRYCEGKTGNDKQTDILSNNREFCDIVEKISKEFFSKATLRRSHALDLFNPDDAIRDKIKALVLLRGKLRHHSLKSPHRWDPNRQHAYETPARFLGAVVGDIVLEESLADIYSPSALEAFKEISVATGHETRITIYTSRLEKSRPISLHMTYPTTVISSLLCLNTVRNAIAACERDGQLNDTVKFEGMDDKLGLELLSVEFDVWAYSQTRAIEMNKPIERIRCDFECYRSGLIVKHSFSFAFKSAKLTIPNVWTLLRFSFDHIEEKDPTTRIMRLKLFLDQGKNAIVSYRVGAHVRQ